MHMATGQATVHIYRGIATLYIQPSRSTSSLIIIAAPYTYVAITNHI